MFSLHPQLVADTLPLGSFPLCVCRLMNDMHYPWLILVPQRPDVKEIFQMNVKDQQQLLRESSYVAQRLCLHFSADKINIGALGNMVPQLHIHHIARYQNDAAWPAPVWGRLPAQPYVDAYLPKMLEQLRLAFADCQKIGFVWDEEVLAKLAASATEASATATAAAASAEAAAPTPSAVSPATQEPAADEQAAIATEPVATEGAVFAATAAPATESAPAAEPVVAAAARTELSTQTKLALEASASSEPAPLVAETGAAPAIEVAPVAVG